MTAQGSNVSLVLRLLTEAADRGALVGHAEVVDTGEIVPVRDVADLVRLVRRVGHDEVEP